MGSLARIVVPLAACIVLVEASGAATSSPQLIARVSTRGAKPCGSAVYGRSLYVANYGSGTLARVDPRTNKVSKTIRVGDGPCGVVAGGGALWVENFRSSNIVRVDPRRFKVTARINVGRRGMSHTASAASGRRTIATRPSAGSTRRRAAS